MVMTIQAQWPLFDIFPQWARACVRPNTCDPLDRLGSGEEMQRIRAHLRASPDDLRWLAGRDPGHAELLPHMLRATGLDESGLPQETRAALAKTCGACRVKPHCAEELARGRARHSYPRFCPNAAAIAALRTDAA
jgi:hypothetical protein